MGLAVMTEMPLVIVNSQRGGPSTGLPTKTEQSDLYQAVYGRNGDAPMPVIAARSPADAFDCAIEACRIAVRYMTPVMLLTDGYIANAAEPWKVPDMSAYEPFPVSFAQGRAAEPDNDDVMPYQRNGDLARPWIKPGTPGLEHSIGGIEKQPGTGNIDYSPEAHAEMTRLRAAKVAGVADSIGEQEVCIGNETGKLAVVGWGSTFGPSPPRWAWRPLRYRRTGEAGSAGRAVSPMTYLFVGRGWLVVPFTVSRRSRRQGLRVRCTLASWRPSANPDGCAAPCCFRSRAIPP